jgi:hypothetical protein
LNTYSDALERVGPGGRSEETRDRVKAEQESSSAPERCDGDRMSERLTMRKIREALRLHEEVRS